MDVNKVCCHCGTEVPDPFVVCASCGAHYTRNTSTLFGWALVSFCYLIGALFAGILNIFLPDSMCTVVGYGTMFTLFVIGVKMIVRKKVWYTWVYPKQEPQEIKVKIR
ncbi:hypothetical protein ACSWYU_004702 [Vibrio harveyi]